MKCPSHFGPDGTKSNQLMPVAVRGLLGFRRGDRSSHFGAFLMGVAPMQPAASGQAWSKRDETNGEPATDAADSLHVILAERDGFEPS